MTQPGDLAINPPRQERSRQAWARILDAGVALVEEGGYEAFTIAAVCERAQVAPRALYDRTSSKEALFLAVYEHGIARMLADQEVFTRQERWAALAGREAIDRAVRELAAIFDRHARFLKQVVLLSGAHSEVRWRGREHVRRLADHFGGAVTAAQWPGTRTDLAEAVQWCFSTVFSGLVLRLVYGSDFAAPDVDDAGYVDRLVLTAQRYLLV
ncbi:TetR/AcrR family transcriptional regulator [Actinomadura sp. 9N407]|uniref:TetR/AcrR family transcriptional regulator n=1 Tax=Actinomadura sp. 9N407 TaxID=3375154 RepID=UPI0037B59473